MEIADLSQLIGDNKIYKFWNLKIGKKEETGNPFVSFVVHMNNQSIRCMVPITFDKLLDISSNLTINNGYIVKYMVFLDTGNGYPEPFAADSEEVKRVLKDVCIKKQDIRPGYMVNTLDNEGRDELNNIKKVYLGEVIYQEKKKHLFIKLDMRTCDIRENINHHFPFEIISSFPKVIEAQKVINDDKVDEFLDMYKNLPF